MTPPLKPHEQELYQLCDEILYYRWDPIGVGERPGARDEYSGYVWRIFSLLREGATSTAIATRLLEIERSGMGLNGNEERAAAVADTLLAWRDHLLD